MITACGYTAVNTAALEGIGKYDFIFNTIPSMIFGEKTLEKTAGGVVIDLASKPGGVDLEACKRLGINGFAALSLPGRTAPQTAAGIIKETICNITREDDP